MGFFKRALFFSISVFFSLLVPELCVALPPAVASGTAAALTGFTGAGIVSGAAGAVTGSGCWSVAMLSPCGAGV
jgi:hypothetical protein